MWNDKLVSTGNYPFPIQINQGVVFEKDDIVVFSSVIRDVKDKTFDSTSVFRYYKIQAFDVTSTCQFCNYILVIHAFSRWRHDSYS